MVDALETFKKTLYKKNHNFLNFQLPTSPEAAFSELKATGKKPELLLLSGLYFALICARSNGGTKHDEEIRICRNIVSNSTIRVNDSIFLFNQLNPSSSFTDAEFSQLTISIRLMLNCIFLPHLQPVKASSELMAATRKVLCSATLMDRWLQYEKSYNSSIFAPIETSVIIPLFNHWKALITGSIPEIDSILLNTLYECWAFPLFKPLDKLPSSSKISTITKIGRIIFSINIDVYEKNFKHPLLQSKFHKCDASVILKILSALPTFNFADIQSPLKNIMAETTDESLFLTAATLILSSAQISTTEVDNIVCLIFERSTNNKNYKLWKENSDKLLVILLDHYHRRKTTIRIKEESSCLSNYSETWLKVFGSYKLPDQYPKDAPKVEVKLFRILLHIFINSVSETNQILLKAIRPFISLLTNSAMNVIAHGVEDWNTTLYLFKRLLSLNITDSAYLASVGDLLSSLGTKLIDISSNSNIPFELLGILFCAKATQSSLKSPEFPNSSTTFKKFFLGIKFNSSKSENFDNVGVTHALCRRSCRLMRSFDRNHGVPKEFIWTLILAVCESFDETMGNSLMNSFNDDAENSNTSFPAFISFSRRIISKKIIEGRDPSILSFYDFRLPTKKLSIVGLTYFLISLIDQLSSDVTYLLKKTKGAGGESNNEDAADNELIIELTLAIDNYMSHTESLLNGLNLDNIHSFLIVLKTNYLSLLFVVHQRIPISQVFLNEGRHIFAIKDQLYNLLLRYSSYSKNSIDEFIIEFNGWCTLYEMEFYSFSPEDSSVVPIPALTTQWETLIPNSEEKRQCLHDALVGLQQCTPSTEQISSSSSNSSSKDNSAAFSKMCASRLSTLSKLFITNNFEVNSNFEIIKMRIERSEILYIWNSTFKSFSMLLSLLKLHKQEFMWQSLCCLTLLHPIIIGVEATLNESKSEDGTRVLIFCCLTSWNFALGLQEAGLILTAHHWYARGLLLYNAVITNPKFQFDHEMTRIVGDLYCKKVEVCISLNISLEFENRVLLSFRTLSLSRLWCYLSKDLKTQKRDLSTVLALESYNEMEFLLRTVPMWDINCPSPILPGTNVADLTKTLGTPRSTKIKKNFAASSENDELAYLAAGIKSVTIHQTPRRGGGPPEINDFERWINVISDIKFAHKTSHSRKLLDATALVVESTNNLCELLWLSNSMRSGAYYSLSSIRLISSFTPRWVYKSLSRWHVLFSLNLISYQHLKDRERVQSGFRYIEDGTLVGRGLPSVLKATVKSLRVIKAAWNSSSFDDDYDLDCCVLSDEYSLLNEQGLSAFQKLLNYFKIRVEKVKMAGAGRFQILTGELLHLYCSSVPKFKQETAVFIVGKVTNQFQIFLDGDYNIVSFFERIINDIEDIFNHIKNTFKTLTSSQKAPLLVFLAVSTALFSLAEAHASSDRNKYRATLTFMPKILSIIKDDLNGNPQQTLINQLIFICCRHERVFSMFKMRESKMSLSQPLDLSNVFKAYLEKKINSSDLNIINPLWSIVHIQLEVKTELWRLRCWRFISEKLAVKCLGENSSSFWDSIETSWYPLSDLESLEEDLLLIQKENIATSTVIDDPDSWWTSRYEVDEKLRRWLESSKLKFNIPLTYGIGWPNISFDIFDEYLIPLKDACMEFLKILNGSVRPPKKMMDSSSKLIKLIHLSLIVGIYNYDWQLTDYFQLILGEKNSNQKKIIYYLNEFINGPVQLIRNRKPPGSIENSPVVLLFNPNSIRLFSIPWTTLPQFSNSSVCWAPDPQMLIENYLRKPPKLDSKKVKTFHVVNPGGDLPNAGDAIPQKLILEGFRDQPPDVLVVLKQLAKVDLYIYAGHSGGTQFIPRELLFGSSIKAVCLLMGCSSIGFEEEGSCIDSLALDYIAAGSPCVIGLQWDVTDAELDRFVARALNKWTANKFLQSINNGRDACKLKCLTGSSVTSVGIPI